MKFFEKLKPVYVFLFEKHFTGFFRILMAALVPCIFFPLFHRIWLWTMTLLLSLLAYALRKGWNIDWKDEGQKERNK